MAERLPARAFRFLKFSFRIWQETSAGQEYMLALNACRQALTPTVRKLESVPDFVTRISLPQPKIGSLHLPAWRVQVAAAFKSPRRHECLLQAADAAGTPMGGFMNTARRVSLFLFFLLLLFPPGIRAQSGPRFEVGGGYSLLRTGFLEEPSTESGVMGRLGYDLHRHVSVEGEFSLFPRDLGIYSKGMTTGFFGAKVGERFERVGVFGKVRPGFIHFHERSGPFACAAVDPPTLPCLIGGRTEFAVDAGGVLEFYPQRRMTVRVDAGDAIIRMRGPVLLSGRPSDGFWSHNFAFGMSFGFRL